MALDALGATFELECDSVRVRVSLPDSPEAFSARSRQRLDDHDVTTAANVLNSTATDLGLLDASRPTLVDGTRSRVARRSVVNVEVKG